MAAARPENGNKQATSTLQSMQRPKPPHQPAQPPPSPSVPNRYPTIFLNARKQVARSPVPHVVRRLAPAQPRRHVPAVPSVLTGNVNGGAAVLISADNLRRTVYATVPSVSLHATTGGANGLANTIVSFAGKQAITIPVQSPNDLASAVRPTVPTPPATIYKLVNATSGGPIGRKRMPQLAPKPVAKNGEQPFLTSQQQHEQKTMVSAPNASTVQYNNAPGWRRILRNKVIVYISPSNIVLHNYEQVKEYLLSSGTCKCGLPCPFNPELFFQFDAQIPNMTMASNNREVLCAHLQRAITGPERLKRLHEETTPSENTAQEPAVQNAILLKTPPWRKNVPMTVSSPQTTPVSEIALNSTPIARLSKPSDVIGAPFARSPSDANVNQSARDSPEQKKPTFKDDPTGYLNQQTAILHSSISFLHSPDRRSPLPLVGGLSPKLGSTSPITKPSPPKEDGSAIISRQRTVNRNIPNAVGSHPTTEPQAKITSLTGVVKYETKPPCVSTKSSSPASASSIKSSGTPNASKSPLPIARLATSERGRMAYYVKANNAIRAPHGTDQCSSPKVPKMIHSPAGESLPCPITATTTTTTTTIARTNPITAPTTTGTMFVPTRSSHVINAGGAQIVVIDGLQHSAIGTGTELPGRVRIGGFAPVRHQIQPATPGMVPSVSKPAIHQQPTVVNYSLARAPNGTATVPVPVSALSTTTMPTTTTGTMLLNGTNIIHLSNGLSAPTFHGGLLAPDASNQTGTNPCLHQVSPTANKTSLTLPNGTLGLAAGSTVVLNPTTSIRFADNTSFTTPGGFSTASNTYHYSPCTTVQGTDTVSLDVTGARKVKRQIKPLNGTTSSLASGLVLPASSVATLGQPQPTTFQQQLQPGPFVQIASPYGGLQNIQLASSLSGITVVPVSKATPLVQQHQPHQQQHHQQPYGLLGQTQTILLPAGSMVMASDANTATATLLQIQNMAPCGGNAPLLAGQTGLVLRQPKPQSTAGFISTVGQQSYLIGANGTTGTARAPTVTQRCPLVNTSTGTALFGNGGGLGIVTATPSLPVANLTMQQPQQLSLVPPTPTNRTDPAPQTPSKLVDGTTNLTNTVLVHPDITTPHNNQPECSAENGNETKPVGGDGVTGRTELKGNHCVSISETEVPGMAFTLKGPLLAEQQKKQQGVGPLAESSNRTGRIVSPASGGRAGSIGFVRRGPSVQAVVSKLDRGKLSIAIPPTTTEGSTCLLTDVRPEQSYDGNAALSQKSCIKSRTKRRLLRGQNDADDLLPDEPKEQQRAATCQFRVGDLVWGAVRGFPAWPGKVLPTPTTTAVGCQEALKASTLADATVSPPPSAESTPDANVPQQGHVWVRWFGTGRASAERVEIGTLQSLSEGLEIHHRAQKDARKSRKLNAQLEQAIQQAMQELDHAATSSGFNRTGSGLDKQRRRRHQRRQPTCKRHRTGITGNNTTGSVNSNMCNRKGASMRYLRGNKFKAKS
ncbi:mucin-4 [Anopheles marshallii]|uniref:mucin-4 n=1 Tax=Anopheles marshallii TaxID=1521116 RepID=UPI00237AACC9|nr:mucin-4 [Anopheles marshallii]